MNFGTIFKHRTICLVFFLCLASVSASALVGGWGSVAVAGCLMEEPGNQFGVDPILDDATVVAIVQSEIDLMKANYKGPRGLYMNDWGVVVGTKKAENINPTWSESYPTPIHYWLNVNPQVRSKVDKTAAELRRNPQELPRTWHWSAVCESGRYKGSYTGQWIISSQDTTGNVSGKFTGHAGNFRGSITRSRVHFVRTFRRGRAIKQEWVGALSEGTKSGQAILKVSGTLTDPEGGCNFTAWANCSERFK